MGLDIKKDSLDEWEYKRLLPTGQLRTQAEVKGLQMDFLKYWPGRVKEKFNKSVWFPIDADYERELFEMSGYRPEGDEMKEQKDLKFHTGVLESPKTRHSYSWWAFPLAMIVCLAAVLFYAANLIIHFDPLFFCFGVLC